MRSVPRFHVHWGQSQADVLAGGLSGHQGGAHLVVAHVVVDAAACLGAFECDARFHAPVAQEPGDHGRRELQSFEVEAGVASQCFRHVGGVLVVVEVFRIGVGYVHVRAGGRPVRGIIVAAGRGLGLGDDEVHHRVGVRRHGGERGHGGEEHCGDRSRMSPLSHHAGLPASSKRGVGRLSRTIVLGRPALTMVWLDAVVSGGGHAVPSGGDPGRLSSRFVSCREAAFLTRDKNSPAGTRPAGEPRMRDRIHPTQVGGSDLPLGVQSMMLHGSKLFPLPPDGEDFCCVGVC